MIFIHYSKSGARRTTDLQDAYAGRTALLVGGAPSLKEQPIELLEQRGVLTMAMNNAAMHFRPTLWVSSDPPECYDPQILLDPTIIKFANITHAERKRDGIRYRDMPGVYFYIPERDIPWEEFFGQRAGVPWYHNTLFVGLYILHELGVRKIILAGSEFGFSEEGSMYAHRTDKLGTFEQKWNLDLYNSLVKELRRMKPVFDAAGVTLMDSSKTSRISQVYEHISLKRALELCLEEFPASPVDSSELPHCSKFAPKNIQERIAKWPGHQRVGHMPASKDTRADTQSDTGMKAAI